ncbi:site-specific DNA-methyltransferase [Marinimicrobium sp. ABcell2]|uniref:DNA-methyltransferase n=1 Tax=Marinimicrobium sp. ABcell2 TaxID=3069751 RepID=UPI0027B1DD02|nr:site-specific DNA-methyltransferase [Marinimicrobium sp. ABcell2]MDQ2077551.1 site-specific DNA-methyltransferase [Marinimicrobium sp. ABcell2]
MSNQLDLFHVQRAYSLAQGPLSNDQLYQSVAEAAGLASDALNQRCEIGRAKAKRSPLKRKIRWYQQTLKAMGVLRKVEGRRGVWELAEPTDKGLHQAPGRVCLLAYSTRLGVAIWGDNNAVFSHLDEPIHLCVTSPPYPLRIQRRYGNVAEHEWVDFITQSLEPIVKQLAPGGSVVLNVSNDIFEVKKPSRSLYIERMVLALHDRLGLSLMDRWPWVNLSKPPGPTHWACVNRQQLCVGWEPVFWFTNDPLKVRSDNRRVLEPHTDRHRRLLEQGGDTRVTHYGDGAHRLRGNGFDTPTDGRIPKNVMIKGHRCSDSLRARAAAKRLGLPAHPAMFPTALAEFAIRFLTREGDLVVDLFSGVNKTGMAAERHGRRWIASEIILQYIKTQAELFSQFEGFWLNPALAVDSPDRTGS